MSGIFHAFNYKNFFTSGLLLLFFFSNQNIAIAEKTHRDSVTEDSIRNSYIHFDSAMSRYILAPVGGLKLVEHGIVKPRYRVPLHTTPDYYLYILVFCLLLITATVFFEYGYIMELFVSFANNSRLQNFFSQGKFGFNALSFVFDFVFITCTSIFIQLRFFSVHEHWFLWIVLFTSTVYYLKIFAVYLFSYVFTSYNDLIIYNLNYLLYTRLLGIVMLPVLFFGLYQKFSPVHDILNALLFFFIVTYLIWLLRLYWQMGISTISYGIYILVYLCAVEISPWIFILKYNFTS